MNLVALSAWRTRVDGGPDEGMPKRYRGLHHDQSACDRRVLGLCVGTEVKSSTAHECQIAGCLGGRHQQEHLRTCIESSHRFKEVALELAADGHDVVKRLASPQLLLRQSDRELDQRQWTSTRFPNDASGCVGVNRGFDARCEQLKRCVVGQPIDLQDGKPVESSLNVGQVAYAEQQCDTVGVESSRNKAQRFE